MGALRLGLSMVMSCVVSCVVLAACASREPEIQADPAIPAPAPAPTPTPERKEREHYLGMAVPEHEPVPWPNVNGECEPGQVRRCRAQIPLRPGGPPLVMHCTRAADGSLHFDGSECATPLVVAFYDAPVEFVQPVGASASFAVGPFTRTEWVSARTPWLALDRDGSGCIEEQGELFRFDELAALDDDHDGRIDAQDAAYDRLVLWSDRDGDRRCVTSELTTLREAGIVALDVAFAPKPPHAFGSHEGEAATMVYRANGGALRRGRIVDVYLAPMP